METVNGSQSTRNVLYYFFLFFSKVKDGRSYYPLRPMYDEWDGQNQAVG